MRSLFPVPGLFSPVLSTMKKSLVRSAASAFAAVAMASSSYAVVFADVSVIPPEIVSGNTTLPDHVSFSRPAGDPAGPNKPPKYPAVTTYVVYKVSAANGGPNTVNHVRAVLQSGSIDKYVPPPNSPPNLTFSNVIDPANVGVTCGPQGGQFACDIGQLRAPGSTGGPSAATFYMVFTTPLSPAVGSVGPFIVNFTWHIQAPAVNAKLNPVFCHPK